jgi:hypothetical protein
MKKNIHGGLEIRRFHTHAHFMTLRHARRMCMHDYLGIKRLSTLTHISSYAGFQNTGIRMHGGLYLYFILSILTHILHTLVRAMQGSKPRNDARVQIKMAYTYISLHTLSNVHKHTFIHTYIAIVCTHTYIHTYIHSHCLYTYIHSCIHT